MSTLMQRLLDDFAVFDYATKLAANMDSTDVPDPVTYRMDEASWADSGTTRVQGVRILHGEHGRAGGAAGGH